MKTVFAVLVLAVLASSVAAQDLPEKPQPQDHSAYFETEWAGAPHQEWYRSKMFWGTFSVSAASMETDYYTSQRAFRHGWRESDPLFGSSRPSLTTMNLVGIPVTFLFDYTGFKMSQSRHRIVRKLSFAPAAYVTALHTYLTVENVGDEVVPPLKVGKPVKP